MWEQEWKRRRDLVTIRWYDYVYVECMCIYRTTSFVTQSIHCEPYIMKPCVKLNDGLVDTFYGICYVLNVIFSLPLLNINCLCSIENSEYLCWMTDKLVWYKIVGRHFNNKEVWIGRKVLIINELLEWNQICFSHFLFCSFYFGRKNVCFSMIYFNL